MKTIEIKVDGETFTVFWVKDEDFMTWVTTMENAAANPDWHSW